MHDYYEYLNTRPDLQVEYVRGWIMAMLKDKYLKDGEQMRELLGNLADIMGWSGK